MSSYIFEVVVEKAFDKEGDEAFLIKISNSFTEANIYIKATSIHELFLFHKKKQDYCLLGESANTLVHWKRNDDIYILIGEDQDVWDICIIVNNTIISEIVSAVENM